MRPCPTRTGCLLACQGRTCGTQGGIRTHKILILNQTRMPVPSLGRLWLVRWALPPYFRLSSRCSF